MRTTFERWAPVLFWCAILLGWELAWRLIGWKFWLFPAPSHILDALAHLLHVNSGFSEPLTAHWPRPSPDSVAQGGLLSALATSLVRLCLGYATSVGIGMAFGLACFRWAWFDR